MASTIHAHHQGLAWAGNLAGTEAEGHLAWRVEPGSHVLLANA